MKGQLRVGETLNEIFATYGAHAGVLLPAAFWLFLVVAIISGVAGDSASLLLLSLLVSLVAGTLYQGMVVGLVRDAKSGRPESSVGELFSFAAPFVLPLLGVGILAALGILVGFALLIVPGLFLLTIWAVIAPAIVVEGKGVFEAFGRSRELVRGFGWPVFWVVIVAALITAAGGVIFGEIANGISDGPILRIVFGALAATITAPITALAAAVLYYRLLGLQAPAPAAEPVDVPPPTN